MRLLPSVHASCIANPTAIDLIFLMYFTKGINYEAPHHAASCILLLLPVFQSNFFLRIVFLDIVGLCCSLRVRPDRRATSYSLAKLARCRVTVNSSCFGILSVAWRHQSLFAVRCY
jgi:hypothetical protein